MPTYKIGGQAASEAFWESFPAGCFTNVESTGTGETGQLRLTGSPNYAASGSFVSGVKQLETNPTTLAFSATQNDGTSLAVYQRTYWRSPVYNSAGLAWQDEELPWDLDIYWGKTWTNYLTIDAGLTDIRSLAFHPDVKDDGDIIYVAVGTTTNSKLFIRGRGTPWIPSVTAPVVGSSTIYSVAVGYDFGLLETVYLVLVNGVGGLSAHRGVGTYSPVWEQYSLPIGLSQNSIAGFIRGASDSHPLIATNTGSTGSILRRYKDSGAWATVFTSSNLWRPVNFAYSYTNPNLAYVSAIYPAGTAYRVGYFVTLDAGATWAPVNFGGGTIERPLAEVSCGVVVANDGSAYGLAADGTLWNLTTNAFITALPDLCTGRMTISNDSTEFMCYSTGSLAGRRNYLVKAPYVVAGPSESLDVEGIIRNTVTIGGRDGNWWIAGSNTTQMTNLYYLADRLAWTEIASGGDVNAAGSLLQLKAILTGA